MNTNQKIARASFVLIAVSIIGHIVSLAKEMLVAYTFGIGSGMDAYYAAISIPTIISTVLVSTFGIVFIPIFIKYKTKDIEEANRVSSTIINLLFIFLLLVSAVLYFSAPWVMKYAFHGLEPESMAFTVQIFHIVCFTIILSGLIGIISGILNSYEHFGWPALTQMFVTIITIILILLFSRSTGVLTLAYGLLAGLACQFLFLLLITFKKGYRYYMNFNWKHPAIKEMASLASSLLVVALIVQVSVLVDRIMASYLPSGSISALGYADKLVQVPLLIFSSSIATAIFPYLSYQVAEHKIVEFKNSVESIIKMVGLIFIPLTVMLIILARPIIQLLFERGAFDKSATNLISFVFIFYSMQMLFSTCVLIFSRVYIAMGLIKEFLTIVSITLICKIGFNYLFMNIMTPKIAGIALSTTVTFAVSSFMYILIIENKKINFNWKNIFSVIRLIAFASAIMGLVVFAVFYIYGIIFTHASAINNALRIAAASLSGIAAFALTARKFKIEGFNTIIKTVKIFH